MIQIPLREKNGRTSLTLKVTPRSSANKIQALEQDLFGDWVLKLSVTAVPDRGKANQGVIELLSKTLKIPKTALTITAGKTARMKLVSIEASGAEVWRKLQKVLSKP